MRTMNKIVALSLVLAMAFSMMASAANFKDQSDINATLVDEINLLVALGVYAENGTGAGYFEPNMTITRAQAAKILYVLKNKGVDNGATSWTGLNIFTDVEAGAWYEGYANYCASTGIMIGTADGIFTPNGKLTGVELAKMLLVLIGYKADVEGYTGAGWDNNILADAEEAGILEAYELPVKGIVTREWAAKMIVNALYANKVRYADGVAEEMYSTATTENNITVYKPVTYVGQDLGLVEATGYAMGTPKFTIDGDGAPVLKKDGKTSVVEIGGNNKEIAYEITADQLGQEVKVLYKDNDNTVGLSKADKIYGVTVTGTSKVYEVALADITFGTGANANKFKFAGYNNGEYKAYGANDTVVVYDDFYASTMKIADLANFTKTPYSVKIIDKTGDGTLDTVFTSIPTIAEVKNYRADKFVFSTKNDTNGDNFDVSTEKAFANFNFVDEIAKGDIVKVSYDYTSGKLIYNIEKVDSVAGKVTKLNSNGSFVIGEETYKNCGVALSGNTAVTALNNNEYTYYVEGNYVVYSTAVANKEDQSNIVLLLAVQDSSTVFADDKIQVLKADGTKEIIGYFNDSDNKYSNDVAIASLTPNKAYEMVTVGEKVYLADLKTTVVDGKPAGENIVVNGTTGATIAFDADKKTMAVSGSTYWAHTGTYTTSMTITGEKLIAEDAFFFMKNSAGAWKVVKASELSSSFNATAATQLAFASEGVPTVKYAVIATSTLPTTTSTGVKFGVLGTSFTTYTDADNVKVDEIAITHIDGTTATLVVKNTGSNVSSMKGNLVSYTVTDGYATIDVAVKNDNAYFAASNLTAVSGKTLYIGGAMKTAADDMKIYTVDQKTDSIVVVDGNELILRDVDATSANNILFSVNNSGKVDMVIVEVDGEAITLVK